MPSKWRPGWLRLNDGTSACDHRYTTSAPSHGCSVKTFRTAGSCSFHAFLASRCWIQSPIALRAVNAIAAAPTTAWPRAWPASAGFSIGFTSWPPAGGGTA